MDWAMDWLIKMLIVLICLCSIGGVFLTFIFPRKKRSIRPAWRNKHNGFICIIDRPFPSCDYERAPHLDQPLDEEEE
jgi:hypothetical protein